MEKKEVERKEEEMAKMTSTSKDPLVFFNCMLSGETVSQFIAWQNMFICRDCTVFKQQSVFVCSKFLLLELQNP